MKRKLTILLSLLLTFSANATEPVKNLAVWTKDGTKVLYSLLENPKITFTATDVIITTNSVDITYALENMLRFTYETHEPSIINDVILENTSFTYDGESLFFSSLPSNSVISIHTLNGLLIYKKTICHDCYLLPLSNLSAGVYLVSVNGLTYKIAKK